MKFWALVLTMVMGQAAMAIHPSGLTASLQTTFSKAVEGDSDKKLLIAAKDDALAYVASGGEIRGPQLEAALHMLRVKNPAAQVSDNELVQAIVILNQQ